MKTLSDRDVLLTLAEGENLALDVFFERHSGRIYSYAQKKGFSAEQAQDLVQIVFLQIFRKKHLYDPRYEALAWLYVITKSELRDYRRRELKDFSAWDDSLSQTPAPTPNTRQELEALLKDLKPKEKEALKMRYLEDMEFRDIAKRLSEKESNVRQIISRALKRLRREGGSL